jgi:hypothetical protein
MTLRSRVQFLLETARYNARTHRDMAMVVPREEGLKHLAAAELHESYAHDLERMLEQTKE